MSKFIYVSGRYLPYNQAMTHVEDRGYQFADGVYEVICLVQGQFIDLDPHLDRLESSLKQLKISLPLPRPSLKIVIREIIQRNRLKDGMIYIQVTRGIAEREHRFPRDSKPVIVVYGRHVIQEEFMNKKREGVALITYEENRWSRPDIKSISLLGNVLAKQAAIDAGAYDVAYVSKEGYITETTSSNLWILNDQGQLQTHPANQKILHGITRRRLMKISQLQGVEVKEAPFNVKELYSAQEAFLSSSVAGIIPVVKVDNQLINKGKSGRVTLKLAQSYINFTKSKS